MTSFGGSLLMQYSMIVWQIIYGIVVPVMLIIAARIVFRSVPAWIPWTFIIKAALDILMLIPTLMLQPPFRDQLGLTRTPGSPVYQLTSAMWPVRVITAIVLASAIIALARNMRDARQKLDFARQIARENNQPPPIGVRR